MRERINADQLWETLQGYEAIPFFFVPKVGFILGGDMKKLNDEVGNLVNPIAQIFKEKLEYYSRMARWSSPHTAYYRMTGESHGHLNWIGEMSYAAHIPDYNLQAFFEQNGIFGHDTAERYRFYKGRNPNNFFDDFLVKLAVTNLHAAQKDKGLTIVDCREMSTENHETLVDFLNEQDTIEYIAQPAPFYSIDDSESLFKLAIQLKLIVREGLISVRRPLGLSGA